MEVMVMKTWQQISESMDQYYEGNIELHQWRNIKSFIHSNLDEYVRELLKIEPVDKDDTINAIIVEAKNSNKRELLAQHERNMKE